jgi:hypothetical protein
VILNYCRDFHLQFIDHGNTDHNLESPRVFIFRKIEPLPFHCISRSLFSVLKFNFIFCEEEKFEQNMNFFAQLMLFKKLSTHNTFYEVTQYFFSRMSNFSRVGTIHQLFFFCICGVPVAFASLIIPLSRVIISLLFHYRNCSPEELHFANILFSGGSGGSIMQAVFIYNSPHTS